jgi:Rrf2 family nitric oxide-sensitive transcriptional repressor
MLLLDQHVGAALISLNPAKRFRLQIPSMKLRRFTDYALRVLIYAGERPDRRCSIPEIAAAHHISEHHLVKVAHQLGRLGYLETIRGRGGGLRLARPPETISVGEVVRRVEGDEGLVDCAGCILGGGCGLACALADAQRAFHTRLDQCSLRQILRPASVVSKLSGPRHR